MLHLILTFRVTALGLFKQLAFCVFFPICLTMLFGTSVSHCASLPAGGMNWALNGITYEDLSSPCTVWPLGKLWPLLMPRSTTWQDLPRRYSVSHQLSLKEKKKKGDSIKFSKMLDGRWKHLSDVFLCGTSKGEMSRLFLLLLSSCLRGKGNREEEYGAGLLGIFLSPIFLLKKEDQKFQIPRPSCLARPIQMLSVWIGSDQH